MSLRGSAVTACWACGRSAIDTELARAGVRADERRRLEWLRRWLRACTPWRAGGLGVLRRRVRT